MLEYNLYQNQRIDHHKIHEEGNCQVLGIYELRTKVN